VNNQHMTAAVLYGKEDVKIEQVAIPQLGPGCIGSREGGPDLRHGCEGVSPRVSCADDYAAGVVWA
jgi:hypothetical protein